MTLAQTNPIDSPESWDFITIKGVRSPGLAKVSEAKRKHEWDVKKGKGAQGGFVTFVGIPPLTFSVRFELWDNGNRAGVYYPQLDHFGLWDDFVPLLRYDPTKKSVQAVDFYHPSFEGLNLRSVVTESIGNLVHEGNGLYVRVVEFLEYVPPPPVSAVSSPTSSATGPSAGDGKSTANPPDPALVAAQNEFNQALSDAKNQGPL